MRIISGKFKGRKFNPPADDWPTRPTTDFAKEGLFNILNNNIDFEETKMLDLFGGTGNHSYEFVSRGCTQVTYVDKFPGCLNFVRKMAAQLKVEDEIRIFQMDVFRFIETTREKYDYIFAGPPYGMPALDTLPDKIFQFKLLNPDGWFVLEHNPNHHFEKHPNFMEMRTYGKTHFSFFENLRENTEE